MNSEPATSAAAPSRQIEFDAAAKAIADNQLGKLASHPMWRWVATGSEESRSTGTASRLYRAVTSEYFPMLIGAAAGRPIEGAYLTMLASMMPSSDGSEVEFTRLKDETDESWAARREHYNVWGNNWPHHHKEFVQSCLALMTAFGTYSAAGLAGLGAEKQVVVTHAAATASKYLFQYVTDTRPPAPVFHDAGSVNDSEALASTKVASE